MRSIVNLS